MEVIINKRKRYQSKAKTEHITEQKQLATQMLDEIHESHGSHEKIATAIAIGEDKNT